MPCISSLASQACTPHFLWSLRGRYLLVLQCPAQRHQFGGLHLGSPHTQEALTVALRAQCHWSPAPRADEGFVPMFLGVKGVNTPPTQASPIPPKKTAGAFRELRGPPDREEPRVPLLAPDLAVPRGPWLLPWGPGLSWFTAGAHQVCPGTVSCTASPSCLLPAPVPSRAHPVTSQPWEQVAICMLTVSPSQGGSSIELGLVPTVPATVLSDGWWDREIVDE